MSQRLQGSIRVFAKEHGSRSAKVRLRKTACKAVMFVVSSVCTDRYQNSTSSNVHFLPDPKQFLRCHSKKTTISLSKATKACCFQPQSQLYTGFLLMESTSYSAFAEVQYFSLNACVELCRKRYFVSYKLIMLAKQQKLGVSL
jgi:hypothetical protein